MCFQLYGFINEQRQRSIVIITYVMLITDVHCMCIGYVFVEY